ncbi:hypothetical protein OTU49_011663 [Cherax quadricarinatus]|uniref:Uncharacterized protein n=1 Tax=Cherax quadricarinatus TaxID=27406 RepID=A0AAW0YGD0_CHEQU
MTFHVPLELIVEDIKLMNKSTLTHHYNNTILLVPKFAALGHHATNKGVGRLRSGSESEQRVSMRVHRSGTSNAQTPELSRPTDRCVETWANSVSPPVSGGVIRRGSAGRDGTFRYPAKK